VVEELQGAKQYYLYKERCVFCDIIRQETDTGIRVVAENEDFLTIAPYAPRFPFETWILPKRHESAFENSSSHMFENLAKAIKSLLTKAEQVSSSPALFPRTPSLAQFQQLLQLQLLPPQGGLLAPTAANAAQLNLTRWPGPVVALFLGQITPEALVAGAQDPDPTTQRERQCEAYFYAGEHFLIQGQRAPAVQMFQSAVATGVTSLFEHSSAKAELRRLGP